MNKDYCLFATNWWVEKIQTSQPGTVKLDLFKKLLYNKIEKITSLNPSLIISTFNTRNNMLDEISFVAGVTLNIPYGYEMRIVFNIVWIYNKYGLLVDSFEGIL